MTGQIRFNPRLSPIVPTPPKAFVDTSQLVTYSTSQGLDSQLAFHILSAFADRR